MRYKEFQLIKEGYKEVTVKFNTASSDESEVKKYMMAYKDLVNRNQVQGDERNIDWWGKQGWKEFKKFVDAISTRKSKSQKKKNRDAGKSITLEETDKWLIVVPLDKDASCFYGRGSSWCTASKSDNYFNQYFIGDGTILIYFILKDNANKWAIAVGEDDGSFDGEEVYFDRKYFDIEDNDIYPQEFAKQTGLDPQVYINMVNDKNRKEDYSSWGKIEDHRNDQLRSINHLEHMIDDVARTGKQDRETETQLIKYGNEQHVREYMKQIVRYDKDGNNRKVKLDQDMQTLVAANQTAFLRHVSNLTTKTMMYLINQEPRYIEFFESSKVPFEVEKAAIDMDDDVFKHIPNPSEQIAAYTLKHNPVAIHLPYFWSEGNTTNEHLKTATQTAYISMLGGHNGSTLSSWIDDISYKYNNRDLVSKFSSWLLWVAKTYKDDFEGARAVQDYLYRWNKNHPLLKTIYSQFPQIKPQSGDHQFVGPDKNDEDNGALDLLRSYEDSLQRRSANK